MDQEISTLAVTQQQADDQESSNVDIQEESKTQEQASSISQAQGRKEDNLKIANADHRDESVQENQEEQESPQAIRGRNFNEDFLANSAA